MDINMFNFRNEIFSTEKFSNEPSSPTTDPLEILCSPQQNNQQEPQLLRLPQPPQSAEPPQSPELSRVPQVIIPSEIRQQQKSDTWMEYIDINDLCVQDELTKQRLQLELILNQLCRETTERRSSSIDYGVATPPPQDSDVVADNVFLQDNKIRLYEFVWKLLEDDNNQCVRWICPIEGEFEITNSSKIAYLWGQVKRNPNMTYEKFARALRHYYKLGILVNYKHKEKLRYKFSREILNRNNYLQK